MRLLAIVFILVGLTSCGLFKKNKQSDVTTDLAAEMAEAEEEMAEAEEEAEETEPVPIEVEQPATEDIIMSYGEVCDAFLSSLQTGTTKRMEMFFPDVRLAKSIAPDEVAGKSDEQIENEILKGMRTRFINNMEKLRLHAAENNVDLSQLSILNCIYVQSKDPDMVPRVLSVEIGTDGQDYTIPITVLKLDSKTYVFEILNTTGIFDKE